MSIRPRRAWNQVATLLFCGLAAAAWFGLLRPKPRTDLIAIHFVGITNDTTGDYGVFIITNQSNVPLQFAAVEEDKLNGNWPGYTNGLPHNSSDDIRAYGSYEWRAPLSGDGTPIRLSVVYSEPMTPWEKRRWATGVWLYNHKLPGVGQLLFQGKPGYLILGPEVHK